MSLTGGTTDPGPVARAGAAGGFLVSWCVWVIVLVAGEGRDLYRGGANFSCRLGALEVDCFREGESAFSL